MPIALVTLEDLLEAVRRPCVHPVRRHDFTSRNAEAGTLRNDQTEGRILRDFEQLEIFGAAYAVGVCWSAATTVSTSS